MQVIHPQCAGIDVHKKGIVVCMRLVQPDGSITTHVRSFRTMTADLLTMLDWLRDHGVTHVAMESTGEFWKPVFSILEGHLDVLVVNAQHVKHVPGRKTDVKDAEWIADLLAHGLLRPSFVPPAPQRALRDLTRLRTHLTEERAAVVNRMQKVLEWANIKLAAVVTDITGVSSRAILQALVAGTTDVTALASLAKGRLRTKQAALEQALVGTLQPHHAFMLSQHLAHLDFLEEQIASVTAQIEYLIQTDGRMNPPAHDGDRQPSAPDADTPPADPPADAPAGDGTTSVWAAARVLCDAIPGIGQRVAETIIAELGTDMSRFPSARHAASWAGLCPGQHESAGKRRSTRIRKGNRYLRQALIQAAHAAVKVKESVLRVCYYRLRTRRGSKKALVAVAHKILRIVYTMLTTGETYQERAPKELDDRQKERQAQQMQRRLERLGYTVHIEPLSAVAA